jgi:hypothetical protein
MSAHEGIRFSPRADGREEDCQCARCGSSAIWIDCNRCGGEGEIQDCRDWTLGGLIEDYYTCSDCRGMAGWWCCASEDEWCKAHPLPGRESIQTGEIEWFDVRPASPPLASSPRGAQT